MSSGNSNNPLYHIPAQPAPEGETSNLINPPSRSQELRTTEVVFVSIMLLTVCIRVFVRLKWTKIWGWSDYACVIAALGSVAHMVMVFESTQVGFGRHMWDIPVAWLINNKNIRLMSATGIIFPVTVFFTKASILLLYLQIFSISRPLRISIHIGMLIMALFYTAMLAVSIPSLVRCVGLKAATTQFCKNAGGLVQALNSAFNVVTDFWILILPMPLIIKLQLPKARKIGLIVVFAVGLASCAASLARLSQFAIRYHSTDVLWDHAVDSQVSVIEMNTAIMVSCATSLPSFFLKTKVYLQLTTSSIRSRITGFVESRSASRKPSRERLGDNSDHFTELRDLVPPVKPDRVYTHPAPKLSPSPSIRA